MKKLASFLIFVCMATFGFAGEALGELVKLKIAHPQVFSNISSSLAKAAGYYEENGIDLEFQEIVGPAATAALVGGSVQFAAPTAPVHLAAVANGLELIAVQCQLNAITVSLTLSRKVADKLKFNSSRPMKDRIALLKGLRIGTVRPGAAPDVYARWILRKYGFDPDKDAQLVSSGAPASTLSLLNAGQIDAMFFSPPVGEMAEADGYGTIAFTPKDVQEAQNIVFAVITTTRGFAQNNPSLVSKVVKAVSKAGNLLLDNPEQAKRFLIKAWPKLKPEVIRKATDGMIPSVPRDGFMNEQSWRRALEFTLESGTIKKGDITEGKVWTNTYLK